MEVIFIGLLHRLSISIDIKPLFFRLGTALFSIIILQMSRRQMSSSNRKNNKWTLFVIPIELSKIGPLYKFTSLIFNYLQRTLTQAKASIMGINNNNATQFSEKKLNVQSHED